MRTATGGRLPVVSDPQRWCRILVVGADGVALVDHVLEGVGDPDIDAVGHVAQVALLATRRDGVVLLREVSDAMRDLLELAGFELRLRVEVERESERGEQPVGIERGQEEVHARDPPA